MSATQSIRTTIKFSITKRQPFSNPKVPICLQPYKALHRLFSRVKIKTVADRILYLPLSAFWKTMFKIGANSQGSFVFTDQENKQRPIRFRAGNTQFHSIYFNEYAKSYEREVAALIDILTQESSVFYDIGSNWGHHSLYLAAKPGYQGQIYAFEPVPETFRDLSSVVEQANLKERIHCLEVALSDKAEKKTMVLPDAICSGLAQISESKPGVTVNSRTLDDLDLPDPDVIKLDAEGEEAKILLGGKQRLERCKPMIIFESWRSVKSPARTMERFKVLEDLGYTFFQAVFLLTHDNSSYAIQNLDALPEGDHPLCLALYEFILEERFLLSEMNFLACHRDRLTELMEKGRGQQS